MLNQIKIIFRSFARNKSYTFLNLLGLSSGLVVFILITLYTTYEFGYDSHHENKDKIYRVYQEQKGNVYLGSDKFAVTAAPMAPALMADYPEVAFATRFNDYGNVLIKANDEVVLEPTVFTTDPETFKMFSFEVLHGDISSFLVEKNTAVLTESIAIKYFGKTDVLDEVIHFRNEHPMIVVGVIKDMPENSHFVMDIILQYVSVMEIDDRDMVRWNNNSYHTYLMLEEGSNVELLQSKMPEMRAKYADDPIDEDGQSTLFTLQPLPEVHFTQGVNFDIAPSSDPEKLYIYLGIAFMVLIIAGINYVNLATARSINRTKEIGIRKVVGAQSGSLVFQFLLESFLLVLLSLIVSILILLFVLPLFSQFIDRPLTLDFTAPSVWLLFSSLVFGLSILAGIYPSWVLSSFKPVAALKGKGEIKQRGGLFRNILVVFQFAISSGLIISATVLSEQLSFIQNTDMGYTRDQVVVLNIRDRSIRDQIGVFNDDLRRIPGVVAVAGSSSLPNNISSSTNARWPGKDKEVNIPIYTGRVDYDFFELFELEFVAGGAFRRGIESDKNATILNEAAVKAIGWDEPIGKQYITQSGDTGRVVGVLKNFNQHSLHLDIEPLQIFYRESHSRISVKIVGDQLNKTVAAIEAKFNEYNPEYPFDYNYFDDIFDRAYLSERKTAQLARWFTGLTILVACLGLYGLAAHKVQQRIKEVGVRKVLGASLLKILALLSKDFVKLLLIAFIIAAPAAYYIMTGWLEGFAFHINISLFTMLVTLAMMILVAGLTVGYRTYRAAIRNPIEALREE